MASVPPIPCKANNVTVFAHALVSTTCPERANAGVPSINEYVSEGAACNGMVFSFAISVRIFTRQRESTNFARSLVVGGIVCKRKIWVCTAVVHVKNGA
jgi:hypothetical protein